MLASGLALQVDGSRVILLLLMLSLLGCALGVRHDDTRAINARVVSLSNQDVIALTADDIVKVMRRAGFSDERILDLGTDLRNALAASGAAQIEVANTVEAIFAVRDKNLHVSSYRRGNFIFNTETGEIR